MENRKSVVTFLMSEISNHIFKKDNSIQDWFKILDKAREMHKQEYADAFNDGRNHNGYWWNNMIEDCYNQAYGSQVDKK